MAAYRLGEVICAPDAVRSRFVRLSLSGDCRHVACARLDVVDACVEGQVGYCERMMLILMDMYNVGILKISCRPVAQTSQQNSVVPEGECLCAVETV